MDFQSGLVYMAAGLFLGLFAGTALTFMLMRRNSGSGEADVALKLELETTRARCDSEIKNLKDQVDEQRKLANQYSMQVGELNGQLFELNGQKVQLEQKLQNEIQNTAEKLAVMNEAQEKMTDAFAALSKKALDQNSQSFVHHASEVLKRFQEGAQADLQKRQEKISEIVLPVKESLEKVDTHITKLEHERLNTFATMREQIGNMTTSQQKLSETTTQLVNVLRNTKTRGRWGEIQLKRVVEMAGMNQYCDFCEQFNVATEDGALRPDMIVNLPAQRTIVVDAKAPMNAFLEAHDATDDEVRKHHLTRHAKMLRQHVSQLSKKSYFESFKPSPEFVLMFLPNEAVYSAALEHDVELIEFGATNNVIIATPSTLIALLKAAAYGWRQEAVASEVKQVAELGKQLFERLSKMTEHIVKLGDTLDKSVKNYNSMVGSIETRVLTSARRFKDLHVIGDAAQNIAQLDPIETVSRQFQATELKLIPSSVSSDV